MSNFGIKASLPGADVSTAPRQFLTLDIDYPVLKCDLRVNPKNYGIVNFTIASIANANCPVTIYKQAHGYNYIPSFLTAWNYPAGIDGTNSDTSTYGVGDLDAEGLFTAGPFIISFVDNTNFYIVVTSVSGGGTLTNVTGSFRFYIFADDFSDSP